MKKKGKYPSSLIVTIDASHSGLVNGNRFMYLPSGMDAGKTTFVKPYGKPVTDGHPKFFENESSTKTIGRVISSEYKSYGINDRFDKLNKIDDNLPEVVQEIYALQNTTNDYKGTGHIEVKAKITDPDAIAEIIDGRKLTVSIGSYIDSARCSVCGASYRNCDHEIGMSYDGKTAFNVGGNMKFDHLAFVKSPADENAMVSGFTVSDSKDEEYGIYITDEVNIIEYKEDSKLEEYIISEFNKKLEDNKLNTELLAEYKKLEGKGRESSYLFNDRNIYIKHKLGLILVDSILKEINDDDFDKEELDNIREVVSTILDSNKIVDISNDDYNNVINSIFSNDNSNEKEELDFNKEITEIKLNKETIDLIADSVYNKIKNEEIKSDSFLRKRLITLESAILELEDKIKTDEDNLLSYAIKLNPEIKDIDSAKSYFDNIKTTENEIKNEDEEKELEKIIMDKVIPIDNSEEEKDEQKQISVDNLSQIGETYRQIAREKGFMEAKNYFKKMKNDYNLPDNFIF